MPAKRTARPELMAFAAWLRGKMRERRLSGNELARRIDSSGSGVAEWLKALRAPRVETLRRLAAEFETPLEELEALLPAPDDRGPELVSPDFADPHVLAELAHVRQTLENLHRLGVFGERPSAAPRPPDAAPRVSLEYRPPRRPPTLVATILPDDRYADLGLPGGMVVWLDTRVVPEVGDLVRVGYSDPPVLRPYDPDDPEPATAVVRLQQEVR